MSIDVQTEIRNTCLYEGGHFAVLMAMADCANTATGEGIYPGIDLLASNARLKQRRTQDIIQDLRADGVVVMVGPDGEDIAADVQPTGGRGRKTQYRIDLERVQELQGLHEDAGGECDFCKTRLKREAWKQQALERKGAIHAEKGAKNEGKGAISDIKGAISGAYIDRTNEPSCEPSKEPVARFAPEPVVVSQSALPGFEPQPDNFEISDFLSRKAEPSPKKARGMGDRSELDEAYDAYNASAERSGWAICQRRSPLRDGHLRRRLKEIGGIEGWKIVLARAETDDWCCGRVPSRDGRDPFFAHIDYLLREQVITKLMEVQHGDRSRAAKQADGGVLASAARVAARRAAGGAY